MKLLRLLSFIALLAAGLAAPLSVSAASPTPTLDPLKAVGAEPLCVAIPIFANSKSQGSCPAGEEEIATNTPGGPILVYLKLILKLVNGLIGGIIILVLILAGVQYIASVGDPTNVKAAKKRISNAITALVLYLLMFAILNFLIPGGILIG